MNPQLFFEIDFSFFKSFFPSKEDEEEKKKNKKNSKNVNKANISINNSNKLGLKWKTWKGSEWYKRG